MTKQPSITIDADRQVHSPNSVTSAIRQGRETGEALVGVASTQGGASRNAVYVACADALSPQVREAAQQAVRDMGAGARFEPLANVPSPQAQCNLPRNPRGDAPQR